MTLHDFFSAHPRAALGFSGGVDSSFLLAEGLGCGADVRPYFVKTQFQPRFELEDAQRLCRSLGAALGVIELDVLSLPDIARNPVNRCYFCKNAVFSAVAARAAEDGFSLLLDGTNASDDLSDRPGALALAELGVRSPLRECGLTKPEIRALSRKRGLFTWDKPAYACLATRIPSGNPIDAETLERVELAEAALYALGYSDLRVRVRGGSALVQLPESRLPRSEAEKEKIINALSPYFGAAEIDPAGRKDSL